LKASIMKIYEKSATQLCYSVVSPNPNILK